ncbi:purine-binding chemotaxis protein CheW [Bacillus sp. SLBN-46]|uniref:chemotaxis protein CheW n=1 Tax=Bacillus sp. SLBN-46 TaxID=3042283 RepID=UPI00285CBF58|nr:chemotaxis protein CheW [Bacillus sp. SLBN-46]MDR6123780.1 purine-binding chemotaxis protein CheW [Bacillus sp. SLBN-46]
MEEIKVIAFKLGNEEYGLNIDHVQSIERLSHITRVPNVPHYVKGVTNLRGNVIPIIDLQSKLELGEAQYTDNSRVIIVKYENIELGLIVEKTSNVFNVSSEAIEAAASSGFQTDFFEGIAKYEGRLIILLKIGELVKTEASESEVED